jgi:hypothetical protein
MTLPSLSTIHTTSMAPKGKVVKKKASTKKSMDQLVTAAYVTITITTMHEFDLDIMDKSYSDLKQIGFEFEDREVKCRHDGPEMDQTHYLQLTAPNGDSYDELFAKVWAVYAKHHADYNWFQLLIKTPKAMHYHRWHVFRFPNLGIMRSMDNLKTPPNNNAVMEKMAGKMRPMEKVYEVYKTDDKKDLERYRSSFASGFFSLEI